jgi:hypothetical protein
MRHAVALGRPAPLAGVTTLVAFATLALTACGDSPVTPEPDPVTGPVLLTVTAAHPAGTLDAVPDLTWTLAGPAATPAPVYAAD